MTERACMLHGMSTMRLHTWVSKRALAAHYIQSLLHPSILRQTPVFQSYPEHIATTHITPQALANFLPSQIVGI